MTLFEKRELAGGLNVTGVAPYKMHVDAALAEVAFVRSLGVEIRTGVEIGANVAPADLLRDFDAVFLAPGLGLDARLNLPVRTAQACSAPWRGSSGSSCTRATSPRASSAPW